ncbi:hypothetical protein [Salinibaculum rarum]|uniref:hypothetical protein n=1 Tax=Salinibaculum rarum TaxID=3058903 RepID=UPI00265F31BE|nr:hypothetical protein [Salinibaculum sp. KK48]
MAHHERPWEQDQPGTAEKFLKYVGTASIALTALLLLGIVAGLLYLFVPGNEAIGTVVFTGLLVAVFYAAGNYADFKQR